MLQGIQLRQQTRQEIRNLAVVKVQNASTYDRGVPKLEGVTDPRLGLVDHTVRCPTCNKGSCDQHFGYVELARPVQRLGTIGLVLMILRAVCRNCAKAKFWTKADDPEECLKLSETILSMRPGKERLRAISEACRSKQMCPHCKLSQPNYIRRDRTFLDANQRPKDLLRESAEFQQWSRERFLPDEAMAILEAVPKEALSFLGFHSTEAGELMLSLQIVPPPAIRPSNFAGDSKVRSENDLTMSLQEIVRSNLELQDLFKELPDEVQRGINSYQNVLSKPKLQDFFNAWDKLQIMTSGLVNNTIKKTVATRMGLLPVVNSTNKRKVIDMKTRLTGKKGRLRGNLSGKRVDQSGRSVISPDATHDIYELGVPDQIMNKLTFPESVTSWNSSSLAMCIVRGAHTANGALAVRPPGADADHVIWLPVLDKEARVDLASQIGPGWIVERHLQEGDWVLFNRQPSLWKASMMAFQTYRVSGLTFRLPLAVTRPFNADFDGDEMNIHALQTYQSIAEAQEIMATPHQIVSPQSNAVLIGLVQDSLVGGYLLTAQDTFLSEELYMQHLAQIQHNPSSKRYSEMTRPSKDTLLCDFVALEEPAILKPKRLQTGKQVLSSMLPNISFTKTVRNASDNPEGLLKDDVVTVSRGQLLSGRLCKASLGTSTGGFVQMIWKRQGPWAAAKFVSDAQRVLIYHLTKNTVCISIRDTVQSEETQAEVDRIVAEQYAKASNLLQLQVPPEIQEVRGSNILQETLRKVGAKVIENMDTSSGLSIVVQAGSKGNLMNIAQIAGCVGQQTVYGRRVSLRKCPLGTRTLATFAPNDLRPASRGFVAASYLKGLSPTEFFYHQMAGREGIVATAVSTADTGQNQRRMVKGQESQCIMQDGTVRVGNNHIVQVFQGGDDMDGSKLVRRNFEFVLKDPAYLVDFARELRKQISSAVRVRALRLRVVDFMFSVPQVCPKGSPKAYLSEADLFNLQTKLMQCHETLHALTRPLKERPLIVALTLAEVLWNEVHPDAFSSIIQTYNTSMIQPGEGVGAVGSSSIGEPSMQLTLNVFHFSGIASKNVTISGLPRFKELINAADTSGTANMTARLLKTSDTLSKIQQVPLRTVVSPWIERCCLWPLEIQMLMSLNIERQSAGAKRKRDEDSAVVRKLSSWGLKLQIKWFACHIARTTTSAIVKSLRAAQPEWIIISEPHWYREGGGPYIYITQPELSSDHHCKTSIERFQEVLLKEHAVQGIWGVRRAIAIQDSNPVLGLHNVLEENKHLAVDTEGSSIIELAKVPQVDVASIRTTNVLEMSQVFGISTAVSILQAELHKTISFDSAYIDMRHTWLLADSMCRTGRVCAMNRHNMEDLGASLLQRASFEQSLDVFEEGASFGKEDSLSGATERIMVGQPVAIGTGIVHCITDHIERPRATVVKAYENPKKKLGQTASQSFIGSNYETRFGDQDRDCDDSFFKQGIQLLRTTAASERVVPEIAFESVLDLKTFALLRREAKQQSSWTSKEPLQQVMRVLYDDPKQEETLLSNKFLHGIETVVQQSMVGLPKNHRRLIEFYDEADSNNENVSFKIRKSVFVSPCDVPASVVVRRAMIEQVEKFSKNGFCLDLARRWMGSSASELDAHMSSESPIQIAKLYFENSEAVLQERVTDGQIANAILDRLPIKD